MSYLREIRTANELISYRGHPWYHDPALQSKLSHLRAFAGFDIGKAVHPSHFSVLLPSDSPSEPTRVHYFDGSVVVLNPSVRQPEKAFCQIASIWFHRGTRYVDQLARIRELISALHIRTVAFDSTRGEFEALRELHLLPHEFYPVVFTPESKARMAGRLNLYLEQGRLTLLPDSKQRESILAVSNTLKVEESELGHGDAFWSAALALEGTCRPAGLGELYCRDLS